MFFFALIFLFWIEFGTFLEILSNYFIFVIYLGVVIASDVSKFCYFKNGCKMGPKQGPPNGAKTGQCPVLTRCPAGRGGAAQISTGRGGAI